MYEIMVESGFSAAHQLRDYKGICEQLHGHNWKIQIWIRGKSLQENGILIDFCDIKKILDNELQKIDHYNLNDLPQFCKINPTAENLARYLYGELSDKTDQNGVWVDRIAVWESENSMCTYYKEDNG